MALPLLLAIVLVQAAPANTAAIDAARNAIVRDIDASLPREPFETWLRRVVGPDAPMTWEMNDCGEQTGSPADRGRDLPICAQVQVGLPAGRRLHISLAVGSRARGIGDGPPAFWSAVITGPGRDDMTWMKTLAGADIAFTTR